MVSNMRILKLRPPPVSKCDTPVLFTRLASCASRGTLGTAT